MTKNSIIIIIAILFLLIIGVLIFVFINKSAHSSNTTQEKKTSSNNPSEINNRDIEELAKAFEKSFSSTSNWGRCDVLKSVDSLTESQLKTFYDTYKRLFNISVIKQMDYTYIWCWNDSIGDTVYNKIKAL